MWLDIKMVIFFSSQSFIRSFLISTTPSGSSPFIGSSNIKNSGLFKRVIAIPRRCFIPSEKFLTFFLAVLEISKSVKSSSSISSFGMPLIIR